MLPRLFLLLSAAVFAAGNAHAQNAEGVIEEDVVQTNRGPAEQVQQDPGLSTTIVNGVRVTRGKARPLPPRVVKQEETRSVVSLDRRFRGKVFGRHKIVREGEVLYRDQLLPIRQRDDE